MVGCFSFSQLCTVICLYFFFQYCLFIFYNYLYFLQTIVTRVFFGIYFYLLGFTLCRFGDFGFNIIHCVSKNIPNVFDCNLKTNYQILVIFGRKIPDTTCHKMTIQFPTSLNVCFCAIWGKHNQRNITFLSNAI